MFRHVWMCVCVCERVLTHTLLICGDVSVFALVTKMTSEPRLALALPCSCFTHVVQGAALATHTLLTLPTWLWGVTIVTQWTPLTIASLVARFTGITEEIAGTIQDTCGTETVLIYTTVSALNIYYDYYKLFYISSIWNPLKEIIINVIKIKKIAIVFLGLDLWLVTCCFVMDKHKVSSHWWIRSPGHNTQEHMYYSAHLLCGADSPE